jgi:hypothetical protein
VDGEHRKRSPGEQGATSERGHVGKILEAFRSGGKIPVGFLVARGRRRR